MINLINRLLSYSHEKQTPQRFGRYAVMLLMLLTLGVGQMWAGSATATTVYYAVPAGTVGCYTVKLNVNFKGDGADWHTYTMTKTGNTYSGKIVYSASYTDAYGGVGCMQFQLYDGSTYKSQQQPYGSWTDVSTYNGKVYIHDTGWNTASWDSSYKVYFARTSNWDYGTPYVYAWNGSCDYNAGWPGQQMSELTGKTYNGKKIYYKEVGKRYTNVKFSNNGSNQTADLTLYSTNANKMYYYNGSSDMWVTLQYDVTLDQQEGSSGTSSIIAVCGSAMPGSKTAPSKTGYDFNGYYTGTSGGGTKYYNANMTSANTWPSDATGPTTLYAYWTAKTTTVTLNKNTPDGETVSGATSVTATYNSALPSFTAQTCTGGYALKGYYDASSGGNKIINADGSFNANSGIWNRTDGATLTLYAQWSLDRTLTYDANGGTGTMTDSNSPYANGATVTTLSNTFTRTGYSFTGWNTVANGSGTPYAAGATFTISANTTLHAQWSENMRSVTISANPTGTGTFTVNSVAGTSASVGVTTTAAIVATPHTGYTWSSWTPTNCSVSPSNNKSTTLSGNGSTGSGTLVGNFTLIPCQIVYKYGSGNEIFARGGSGVTSTAMSYDLTTDAYYIDISTSNTQLNYRFYYNNSKEYGTAWNGSYPSIYSVTINGDKVTCNTDVSSWDNKSALKVTYKSGSSIRVWFDKEKGKTWVTETTYTVTVNNGAHGTVSPNGSQTVGKNTSKSLTATPTTNSGWMFDNWSKTGSAVLSSTSTNPTTLTATGTGTVTANYKHRYILRGSTNADNSELGGMAGWDATDNSAYASASISDGVMTITANLTKAKTKYKFKIYDLSGSSWKGQTVTTDIPDNTARTLSGSNNVTLTTTAAGTYTFVYTVSSNSIKVLFPSPVYSVTYGVQSGTGTVTAKIGTESIGASPGQAVGGANVVMTASDGTGYQFSKWVNESGTQISTSNPYTISSIAANCTIKAVFTARNYTAVNNLKEADGTANGQYNVTYDNTSIAHTSAPSRTGYTVEGYYKQAAWTNKIANTNLSLVASTDYATSASKWKVTSAPDLYIKWQQTLTLAGNGAGSTNGSVTTTYLGTASSHTAATRTGYTLEGYYDNTSGGNKILTNTGALVTYSASVSDYINSSGKWIYDGTPTLSAQWTANNYDVTLKANTGTGDDQLVQATYDATMPLTLKNSSTAITVHTKTGYTLLGYWDDASSGNQYYSYNAGTSTLSSYRTWNKDAATNLFAHWSANTYRVTLDVDEEHKGDIASATTYQDVTYDGSTTTVPNRPTAAQGYALVGYYTDQLGEGTKVINGDGTWIASVDGYTDGDAKWVHVGDVTLYAYYKKAEITGITFTDGAVVAPSTSKTVTAVISPTPTGTTTVCWRVLYSNDNPMDPQPKFSSVSGNSVSFTAPVASGMYKMEAVLHLGSGCGGEELSTYVANFQVAGDHDVTVQYKDASGTVIAAPSTVTGRPLAWSSGIEAPEIFGYTFHHWLAGDGVTLSEDGENAKTGARADSSVVSPIYIKAVYDGRLTAVYNQNQIIYFKNTLGWENVYVNFHTGNAWNNTNNPQGSPKGIGNSGLAEKNRNNHMIQIGESDVYYYDYGAASIEPSLYISFTDQSRPSASEFWGDNPDGIAVVYPANYADAISTDKSSENGFKAATPMFVPLASQTPVAKNVTSTGKANYYNRGYWTTYTAGTGYTLEIYYDNDASSCIQSIPFTSEDDLMPMSAVVDLEASTTYRYQVRRGGTSSAGIYYGNTGTMTYDNHGDGTGWIMENTMAGGFKKAKITTNASGNYTFNLSYSTNASNQYRLRMEVDYPIADKDYRLVYSDATQTKPIISAIVTKANNSKDTVSFFIRPASAALVIQQATVTKEGAITWNDYSTITSSVSGLAKDSVYNICLTMDGSGAISVENVEAYTGNFYIRTNAAGSSKWDNFRSSDHLMTYSEYSAKNSDYSHYFMAYVGNTTNIKFVVANDYAPNISDTVIVQTYRGGDDSHVDEDGNIKADANVRFMWNRHNNGAYRAYLAAAKSDGSKFLVLRANSNTDLMDENGNALINSANSGEAGYNHKAPDNSMQFTDDENWIYETTVKVKPNAYVKLYAYFNSAYFYYKGENNDDFDASNAIQLMTGTGEAEKLHVVYDFKTDRLVAAWMPSGDISTEREINADVMFVREHQGDIAQLTFSKGDGVHMGSITKINTAYAVLRFNKWTLNNKSKESGHAVLDPGASRYERDMFYVSFPFRVSMNEVFGFGKYGQHWIIEEYDGAARAANGFWADTPTYWKFITNRKDRFFEPNQGYIIALDLDELGVDSKVWDHGVENVELYFPSYGEMGDITNAEVTYELPEHECTINRPTADGNRTIKDSHWNVMSVPTYVNTSNVSFTNTDWTATRPSFLYEWNMGDNSLTPRSGSGYTYHAMHAYIVQYAGYVTWTSTSVTPASAPNRNPDAPADVEYRLELQQNDVAVDQAFVRLSNEENVSAGFAFGEDMSKEFNKNRSNIYTFIGKEQVAGNCLPMTEQTTVVPVGVIAKTTGDYTFAIPEGTNGVGVTLIDNETGIRTPLSALDYTVNLSAGTYNERFVLEISPIHHMPTGIEEVSGERLEVTGARKVMIDGLLYIVKDGKMFDARGARVQ